MSVLRVGSRGSDLALWQTGWVTDRLCRAHPNVSVERVIIKTHGDTAVDQRFDADWPVGGFVAAIEQALLANAIDFAVHSYKDLPTAATLGLVIAAVPEREIVDDVLVTREPISLSDIGAGFRLGTSSPRRAAQFRRLAAVEIVEIRGNVPTRVAKVQSENLDGVVLAAAGLKRLGIRPEHIIDLPVDRFVPAPAQGALAVQTRENSEALELVRALDHAPTRRAIKAERSFLKAISAGCHTPVGALASLDGDLIALHAQLFNDDGSRLADGVETGTDPAAVGEALAKRLLQALGT